MKVRNVSLKLSILSLAMTSVFTSMYVYADDEEAAALKYPTSSVEVEEIYVSQGSQKFGEYNGLNKQGGYINGNINVRGGSAYKGNENGDTDRWSVTGTNLGLTNRSANVGYSDQGNWSVGVGYDELKHNLAPGYQTPFQGSMGGNQFSIPSGRGFPMSTGGNGTMVLNNTQLSTFNTVDISTTRQNSSLTATKELDSGFSLSVDYNHLNQSGAKLMGFAQAAIPSPTGGTTPTSSAISILPNPTNYQTDTVNLAANWIGEKGRLTGSYFGSFFRDGFNGVNWNTWASTGSTVNTQTMSTAPSNQLQQLNLNGGYDFSSKTKLAGNFSFGRNTQNSASPVDAGMISTNMTPAYAAGWNIPAFNGLVNTTHADVKVTDQSVNDLHLSAGAKYDSRMNLSQSSMQSFNAVNGAQNDLSYYPNTPLSIRKAQIDLAGEYRLTKNQRTGLTYSNQNINRFCNQYASGATPFIGNAPNGSAYSTPGSYYPVGSDCVTANHSRSNLLDAYYKVKPADSVDIKLGYGVDIRQTSYNQGALAAFKGTQNALPTPGMNGGDFQGYQPFFEASRNQQALKGKINWAATEALSTGLNGKYTYSTYPNSTYGVQNATAWSLTWDGTLQYAEEGSVTAYAVQQNGQRNLTNMYYTSASNNLAWNNNLTNHDTTFGLGLKQGGLMSGKLALNSDLTYSLGQSFYSTTPNGGVGTLATTTYSNTAGTASGAFGSPPAIRNDLIGLRFGGTYQIDKSSKVGLQYLYQRLVSSDPYYSALAYGTTATTLLPTNQTAGGYNVNVITVGYTYSFD